jgi:hypothetical protein
MFLSQLSSPGIIRNLMALNPSVYSPLFIISPSPQVVLRKDLAVKGGRVSRLQEEGERRGGS